MRSDGREKSDCGLRVLIVQPHLGELSETFLVAHAKDLPRYPGVALTTVLEWHPQRDLPTKSPRTESGPVLSGGPLRRIARKLHRVTRGLPWEYELTRGYRAAIRQSRPDVVLGEYGTVGVGLVDACGEEGIPLVVHFHGHDATRHTVLERFGGGYVDMFKAASAVVAVSRHMRDRLEELGGLPGKLFVNPCGVDVGSFAGAAPASAPPVLLAVGRLVPKKAPHLTVCAFAEVARERPDARLRVIGEGPLEKVCLDLAVGLGVADQVSFLGSRQHAEVAAEMRAARAFVQHSVEAADGDCEGTPVSVVEAGSAGLPVVATRHAGIPDVVIDGETGLLCDERDVAGMAANMAEVLDDPARASLLGAAAATRVRSYFDRDSSLGRLAEVLLFAAGRGRKPDLFPSAFAALAAPPKAARSLAEVDA
ncbi:glycosyltransferase [Alienimonas californiensis]|uniref:GDP-mannose-dependent alpha-(1-6)-phosphatidylinositol monomannoside mannosyltransferase n=1 Tax=Alienimonas californiensis TaxID=2527989 RepID=A0A517P484_9PLAN|nr:GDP-mannose-dependent alpha-(1-6)-phosphatidylinositol monomannoside mannosyltransferase [Alienimonas californiensis]